MALSESQLLKLTEIAQRFGATRLILFGSLLNVDTTIRDIDVACDGIVGWKLYEFGALLEKEFRIPVDVVPLSPPNPFTRAIETKGKRLL
ncbi:MAG TPA: DNA polymerase III subunit beta [Bacteroidetes bacterium]|nr:DNA polymerase III subunit beta [Bacteroidota bacterium]